jgi:hypothetical protein
MSVEDGQWTVSAGVFALFTLAPAIDLPLDSQQWSQIACSGFVFSEQTDWLRNQYTQEGAVTAAMTCEVDDVRSWQQILSCIPDEESVPDEVFTALAAKMRTLAREDDFLYLPYVGRRLAEGGRLDIVAELVHVSSNFESQLRPTLAAAGDVDSAAALLLRLAESLAAGESADYLELDWLNGVRDPSLLPDLFACLTQALASRQDGPLGALPKLVPTIRRIGGEEAVDRYDALIASSDEPRFRFMRASREEVAQDELNKAGAAAAPAIAASLGLPFLG